MSIFSAIEIERRHERIRAALGDGEAAVVFSFTETYYLSGAPLMRWGRPFVVIVPHDGEPVAVVAEQEVPRVTEHSPIRDLRCYADADGPSAEAAIGHLAAALVERNIQRIAVDGRAAPFGLLQLLRERLGSVECRDLTQALEELRVVSSQEEIAYIRAAASIADHGMRTFLGEARVGIAEVVLAGRASLAMAEVAAEQFPDVEVNVKAYSQQGVRSLQPHTSSNGEPITSGQIMCIVVEAHAWFYQAAIERAVAIGEVSSEVTAFHQTIAIAQAAGIAAVRPGVSCATVDRVCRDIFMQAGYHDIPCGAGLVRNIINEWEGRIERGNLRECNDAPLLPGMVLTIEPWAVVSGIGAPRNCDTVLVTQDGHEVVSMVERAALTIG